MQDDVKFKISAQDRTKTAINSFKQNLKGANAAVLAFRGAIVGLAGVAVLGRIAARTLDAADEIQKLTQRTGVSAEALSQYRFVAQQSGVSFETLTGGIVKMQKSLSDANAGLSTSKKAFDQLGIPLEKFTALKPEQQFKILAEQLSKVKVESDRTRIAMDIFGRSGAALNSVFMDGAAGITALMQEADDLGVTLSQDQVNAAADANDAMGRLQIKYANVANTIVLQLAPQLESLADFLTNDIPKATKIAVKAHAAQFDLLSAGLAASVKVQLAFNRVAEKIPVLGKFFTNSTDLMQALSLASKSTSLHLNETLKATEALGKASAGAVPDLPDIKLGKIETTEDPKDKAAAARAKKEAQRDADQLAKQRENFATRLDNLRVSLSGEEAQIRAAAQKNLAFVAEAGRLEVGTIEEREAIKREVLRQSEEQITDMRAQKRDEKLQEALIERERIVEEFGTDAEILGFALEQRQLMIDNALANRQISEARARELQLAEEDKFLKALLQTERRGYAQRQQFERASLRVKSKTIFNELDSITQGVAAHNKTLFRINQVAAIGQAVIGAYEGISRTLAAYPYPINIALAAAHGVVAFAQVNAIRSQSFDSAGGGAPSFGGGGSVGTFPVDPVNGLPQAASTDLSVIDETQETQREVFVVFQPDGVFSGRELNNFLDQTAERENVNRRDLRIA
ncbi:MAG: hypothetical protein COB61_004265 [Thiotrichales bacterium]|nr:hypothetical protein [Thiotrichales bacterium]